jgi:gamma-glutamyl-gamma-aminobutyrate hydrolase PuuD
MVEPIYDGYRTYVMAAYVKYLEAAGARVVPMMTTEDEATTLDKLSKVNGVLFPGGGGGTNYTDYGRIIYNKAKEYNDQGNFFPMFGICLGMQNMAIWASTEGTSVLDNIAAHNISLPLTFEIPPEQTKMFSGLGEEAWNFAKYNITMNSHS